MNQDRLFYYSSIGSSHVRNDIPCQDSSKVVYRKDIYFGCISDGAGSAKYARLASRDTVNHAIKYLRVLYFSKYFQNKLSLYFEYQDTSIIQCFRDFLESCYYKIRCSSVRRKHSIKDYSCTLLGFIKHPNWTITFQLGDGFIVSRTLEEYQLHFIPAKGEYKNSTYFTNSVQRQEKFQVKIIKQPIKFLCCSSDGMENLALYKGQIFKPFFKSIEANFSMDEDEPIIYNSFEKWLDKDEKVNTKTGDDKSLILLKCNG
jgi:hypothetical protein